RPHMAGGRQIERRYLVGTRQPVERGRCTEQISCVGRTGIFLAVFAMTQEETFKPACDVVLDLPAEAGAVVMFSHRRNSQSWNQNGIIGNDPLPVIPQRYSRHTPFAERFFLPERCRTSG